MMAKVIQTLCDPHLDSEEHAGITLPPISIDGGTTFYVFDSCELGEKELVEPLRQAIAEYGRKVEGVDLERLRREAKPTRKEPGVPAPKQPCPICGKQLTRAGVPGHLEAAHAAADRSRHRADDRRAADRGVLRRLRRRLL